MCAFGVFYKVNTDSSGGYENTISADKRHVLKEAHHKSGTYSKAAEERLARGEPLYVGIDGLVYGEYVERYVGMVRRYLEMVIEFDVPVEVPRNQRNLYLNGPFMERLNASRGKRLP